MTFLIESVQNDRNTDLYRFYRDKKGVKNVEVISQFRPYFYIPEEVPVPDDTRITGVETGFKEILGKSVKKIYCDKSKSIKYLRDMFKKHYEADITISQRYIIDVLGEVETYPLKVLYFDIELDSNNIFADIENPNQKVTSIAMIDNFDKKKTTLILYNKKWTPAQIIELKHDGVQIFDTETELLGAFLNAFVEYDPDIISGWNVEKFDLMYLIRRMNQLDLNPAIMSPLHQTFINDDREQVKIRGRIISDMMFNCKHFRFVTNQGKLDSYSLENVSQEILGCGKIQHIETFREMWTDKPVEFAKYNMRDTELVMQINDKLKIIEFFNQMRARACCQFEQVYHNSVLVDGLLLRRMHNKIVFPSKKRNEKEEFEGAFVVTPTPGVYKNVIALDVKGMYPNIIKTFNIGYETYDPDGEIIIDKEKDLCFQKGQGIIAGTITDLGIERTEMKKKARDANKSGNKDEETIYDFRQYAVKVLMNSFYGVLGAPNSRLYRKEVAAAITLLGRKLIKWTHTVLLNRGYEIVYGDTDSFYIKSKHTSYIDILREGKMLVDVIDESYKKFTENLNGEECTLQIEFEKVFKRIFFVGKKADKDGKGAKKKYAYRVLWEDGKQATDKIKFTGFEVKRSDTPRIGRDAQEKVITMVLDEEKKEDVIKYLKELFKDMKEGRIPAEEYGFPKEIKKYLHEYGKGTTHESGIKTFIGIPPIIKGAQYSNKYLGTRFDKGHKPKFVYLKSVPIGFPSTKVISFNDNIPEGFIPDIKLMSEKIFDMKLTEIFKAAGFGEFPSLDTPPKTLSQWN